MQNYSKDASKDKKLLKKFSTAIKGRDFNEKVLYEGLHKWGYDGVTHKACATICRLAKADGLVSPPYEPRY